MYEDLLEIKNQIEAISRNFKKSPHRRYSSTYLLIKKTSLEDLAKKFNNTYQDLTQKGVNEEELNRIVNSCKKLISEIKTIIDNKYKLLLDDIDLDSIEEENFELDKAVNNIKMATFDIITAIKIIPCFNGEHRELYNFLNIVEAIQESYKDDNEREKLINFVYKTKLAEKVKNRLLNTAKPEKFIELKKLLNENYLPKRTAISVQTELNKEKQNGKSLENFITRIEDLVSNLNAIQLSENNNENKEILCTLNEKVALNVFKNGLNESIKTTILAARPKTFLDACKLAREINMNERSEYENKIFNYNKGGNNNKNNHNTFYRGNNSNNDKNRNPNRYNNYNKYKQNPNKNPKNYNNSNNGNPNRNDNYNANYNNPNRNYNNQNGNYNNYNPNRNNNYNKNYNREGNLGINQSNWNNRNNSKNKQIKFCQESGNGETPEQGDIAKKLN